MKQNFTFTTSFLPFFINLNEMLLKIVINSTSLKLPQTFSVQGFSAALAPRSHKFFSTQFCLGVRMLKIVADFSHLHFHTNISTHDRIQTPACVGAQFCYPTAPNQRNFHIVFHEKSLMQDFFRKTLVSASHSIGLK